MGVEPFGMSLWMKLLNFIYGILGNIKNRKIPFIKFFMLKKNIKSTVVLNIPA